MHALAGASGELRSINAAMAAGNAAAATPTTGVIPAASDLVSLLTASQFATHAKLYQDISAQAAAIHDQMAAMLGLSVRTLQRRLAAEGATFAGLLDEARSQLAQVYVEASARPLAEVAGQLGFQSQAAFNHWHQARFGEPPGARRRRASAALV